MQFSYWVLTNERAIRDSFFEPLQLLALLVASLCHDVDHPGHSNRHEIQMQSHLATRYNDQAVLENHHATCTFEILQESECDFFTGSRL